MCMYVYSYAWFDSSMLFLLNKYIALETILSYKIFIEIIDENAIFIDMRIQWVEKR